MQNSAVISVQVQLTAVTALQVTAVQLRSASDFLSSVNNELYNSTDLVAAITTHSEAPHATDRIIISQNLPPKVMIIFHDLPYLCILYILNNIAQ